MNVTIVQQSFGQKYLRWDDPRNWNKFVAAMILAALFVSVMILNRSVLGNIPWDAQARQYAAVEEHLIELGIGSAEKIVRYILSSL